MKKELVMVLALTAPAALVFAEPRDLGRDIVERKNILGYVEIPEEYTQTCTAYVRHTDTVLLKYIEKEAEKSLNGFINDTSYISALSTKKKANILVTAERTGAYDAELEKLLEEYGLPDKEINDIVMHETINRAAALDNEGLAAVRLNSGDAFLLILNLPNGSKYENDKYVLSEEDKLDNETIKKLQEALKQVYGLK